MRVFEAGRDPPPQFFERPEIAEHLFIYWEAFSDLTTERQIGMGIGPIPRSKTREYARDVLDLTGEAYDQFCAVISRVDSDYVAMQNEPRNPAGDKQRSSVAIDDEAGVKSLFERLERSPRKQNA